MLELHSTVHTNEFMQTGSRAFVQMMLRGATENLISLDESSGASQTKMSALSALHKKPTCTGHDIKMHACQL